MKTQLIFVVYLLFATTSSYAKGAKKIGYRKDVYTNSAWNAKDSAIWHYTQDSLLVFLQASKGSSINTWSDLYRYTTQYNNNKQKTSEIRENWNGTAWVNFTQYVYTYDASNNLQTINYNTWNVAAWKPAGKIEYTSYVAPLKYGKEEVFNWNGIAWNNMSYTIYEYQPIDKKLLYTTMYTWDAVNGWNKFEKNYYQYDQDSVHIVTHSVPNSINIWESDKRFFYNYSITPFRLIETKNQFWDTSLVSPTWVDEGKVTYTYAANNKIENTLTEKYVNSAWEGVSRTQNTYNTSDDLSETFIEAFNGSWTNTSRSTLQYTNSNLTEVLQYTGNGSNWDLAKRINYAYNIENDSTYKQVDDYTGTYTPNYREFFYYSNGPLATVSQLMEVASISLYPNPTSDMAKIELDSKVNFATNILVTDINGNMLTSIQQPIRVGNNTIDIPVTNFSSGNYYVQVINLQTNTKQVFKLGVVK
jgi:hypothetical protein